MYLAIVKFLKHWLFLWMTDVKHLFLCRILPSFGLLGLDNHSMFYGDE